MNVLLTSIGRRVQIVNFFKKAVGDKGKVFTADASNTAPGLYTGDAGFIIPPINSENYLNRLIQICSENKIDLIIPFIDPELPVLAKSKTIISEVADAVALVSDPDVIEIGHDKILTAKFFQEHGIPTVETWLAKSYTWQGYPVIVKPRFGSAGKGVHECRQPQELTFYSMYGDHLIIQRKLEGSEITLDILCDQNSTCLTVVPRKRLKIRAGEVERGITIEAPELLQWGIKIANALRAVGPINVQCFLTDDGPIFTEINLRFGGGYPLSYYAGVNFPKMIIEFMSGNPVKPCLGEYERNLLMLRYDEAVIKKQEELLS